MTATVGHLPIKEGSTGNSVYKVQELLKVLKLYTGQIDGVFGPKTKDAVLKFQSANNLDKDGIVGVDTASALENQAWSAQQPIIQEGSRGDAVRRFQELYNDIGMGSLAVDGVFGPRMKAEVIKYQKSRGLIADGVVGAKTWAVLATFRAN